MERSKQTADAQAVASALHRPAGRAASGADPVLITPESAGWSFAGLRVVHLAPGSARSLDTGPDEMLILPLAGSAVVECEGQRYELQGRASVFARISDFAYVPRDAQVTIRSEQGGEFALPAARARQRLPPAYGPAESVPVEVRGAGAATRQVANFCAPDSFPADRLVAVELVTPAGNWSSYPPHKHDEQREGEAILEEIYYFRIAGPEGFGFHRTYTKDGTIDATVTVRDGDVFLVPRGYHGPCVAAPNHDMYYLNVLAGPGEKRTMALCDDPDHHWVRETWRRIEPDPRVPVTSAQGARR